eukprot:scaffold79846_cov15-Tisochrysis_lutea.AAC.1
MILPLDQPPQALSINSLLLGPVAAQLVPRDRTRSVGTLKPADTRRQQGNPKSTASSWFQGPYKPEPAAVTAPITKPQQRSTCKVKSSLLQRLDITRKSNQ